VGKHFSHWPDSGGTSSRETENASLAVSAPDRRTCAGFLLWYLPVASLFIRIPCFRAAGPQVNPGDYSGASPLCSPRTRPAGTLEGAFPRSPCVHPNGHLLSRTGRHAACASPRHPRNRNGVSGDGNRPSQHAATDQLQVPRVPGGAIRDARRPVCHARPYWE
jgi:hypothetical protein